MINQDVIDLYDHAPVGTKVVVLGSPGRKTPRTARPA
jgi:lipoprotein-anchoring transpeptidase ErfK/SrfK